MYEAKEKSEWRRASPIIAMLFNANKPAKVDALEWDALIPFQPPKPQVQPKKISPSEFFALLRKRR